jgi:hypothetical protein
MQHIFFKFLFTHSRWDVLDCFDEVSLAHISDVLGVDCLKVTLYLPHWDIAGFRSHRIDIACGVVLHLPTNLFQLTLANVVRYLRKNLLEEGYPSLLRGHPNIDFFGKAS